MKTTTTVIKTSLEWPRRSGSSLLFIALGFGFFALSQMVQAVSPVPDGGYPGGNTAEGQSALFRLTTGTYNTAIGFLSLTNNTEGHFNTAIGAGALLSNNPASLQNTPNGVAVSSKNTATGAGTLLSNTTGEANTANGAFALFTNTEGRDNCAFGSMALFANTGNVNSAFGSGALASNITGLRNNAFGFQALNQHTTGDANNAVGVHALHSDQNGTNNAAFGDSALYSNVSGQQNTAVGNQALAFSTGNFNTALGSAAGANVTTATNVICIGASVGANVSDSCYIGNIYSNIQPVIGTDPDYVTIDDAGRLGRSNLYGSSRRFKHDIRSMDNASDVIFGLKPVSFRYNKEYDAAQRLSFGLIAEDVADVAPDLVGRNKQGEPDAVRYEQINAMLLNEFLKEHRKVETLETALEALNKRLREQETKIDKVSARVELNGTPRRKVANN